MTDGNHRGEDVTEAGAQEGSEQLRRWSRRWRWTTFHSRWPAWPFHTQRGNIERYSRQVCCLDVVFLLFDSVIVVLIFISVVCLKIMIATENEMLQLLHVLLLVFSYRSISFHQCPVWGRGTPLPPLSIYFLIFSPLYFSLFFIGFTYFLLLSIPSLSTRIVPLRFQAGGRRRRPNLRLVYVLLCNLCYLYSLVKMDCDVLFYLV